MEDKRELTAAILSAIIAYLQMEQQSSSVTSGVKPHPAANGQQHNPITNKAR
jgi:hypothetical protein